MVYNSSVKNEVFPELVEGEPWKIRVSRRISRCWGYCDYHQRIIVVAAECEKYGFTRQVFLHELIHKQFPWMKEKAVDHLAMELDERLESIEGSRYNKRAAIVGCIQRVCPWMCERTTKLMTAQIIECLDLLEL